MFSNGLFFLIATAVILLHHLSPTLLPFLDFITFADKIEDS